jgi:hypothetical protein
VNVHNTLYVRILGIPLVILTTHSGGPSLLALIVLRIASCIHTLSRWTEVEVVVAWCMMAACVTEILCFSMLGYLRYDLLHVSFSLANGNKVTTMVDFSNLVLTEGAVGALWKSVTEEHSDVYATLGEPQVVMIGQFMVLALLMVRTAPDLDGSMRLSPRCVMDVTCTHALSAIGSPLCDGAEGTSHSPSINVCGACTSSRRCEVWIICIPVYRGCGYPLDEVKVHMCALLHKILW